MAVWHYIYLACTQHKTIETICRVVLVAHTALGTNGQKRACLAALLYHKRICLGPDCASSCHTQLATHKWSVHNKKYCKWKSAGRQWRIPAAVAAQLEASTSTPSPGSSPSPSPVPVAVAAAGHVVACRQLHPVLSWHTKEKQQRTHKTCSSSRSSMWHTPQRRPWSQGPSNKYREFFNCVSVCVCVWFSNWICVVICAKMSVAALHSPLDSYDVVYDGQEHDDTKSVSHLDWPFLIKVRFVRLIWMCRCTFACSFHTLILYHRLILFEGSA